MIVLGLAGQASSGKDTVADYLVSRYGFVKFSFSDALYREVTEAFGLEDESLLRQRETKELRDRKLALVNCYETGFIDVAEDILRGNTMGPELEQWNSPRQILQWWGSEYRRAQDPLYWVRRAHEWIDAVRYSVVYPEQRPQLFVNTSVRFENERAFIHAGSWDANVWHIHRDNIAPVHVHQSETPLPVLDGERQIWNNGGLHHLHQAVDLLLSTSAPTVRCEPMVKVITEEQI